MIAIIDNHRPSCTNPRDRFEVSAALLDLIANSRHTHLPLNHRSRGFLSRSSDRIETAYRRPCRTFHRIQVKSCERDFTNL